MLSTLGAFWNAISSQGWAAVILFGIASACAVTVAVSFGLVGWRYFNPIKSSPAVERVDKTHSSLASRAEPAMAQFELRIRAGWSDAARVSPYLGAYRISFAKPVTINRIILLYNRSGYNGVYEFKDFNYPFRVQVGEPLTVVFMHTIPNIGTFWDNAVSVTELDASGQFNPEFKDERMRRNFHPDSYRCRLVIEAGEDIVKDFSLMLGGKHSLPNVIDPDAFKRYDPNLHIPARGMFPS